MSLFWMWACQEPEPSALPEPTFVTDSEPGEDTGNPGPQLEEDDCQELLSISISYESTQAIQTDEDFDFDARGYLLSADIGILVAYTPAGADHTIADIADDAEGMRVLPDGRFVVALADRGALGLLDLDNGASEVLLGGLASPNGLEVGLDGALYVGEYGPNGRILVVDPGTREAEVLADLDWPNNLALSPDERTLYVVAGPSNDSQVLAFDRDSSGAWQPTPRVLWQSPALLGGLAVDKCGNVYVIDYFDGELYRLPATDPSTPESLVTLPTINPTDVFSSLRFSPGFGGWSRTQLFVTNRTHLFSVDVEIEGRHVLAPDE